MSANIEAPDGLIKNVDNYIPGVCNIGPVELEARKKAFNFALIPTVLISFVVVLIGLDWYWRLLLIIPWTAVGVTYLQVRNKFCVAYGMKSIFNFGEKLGKVDSIKDDEFQSKDKKMAQKMYLQGFAMGIFLTLIFLVL